jgi:hypothetical protein
MDAEDQELGPYKSVSDVLILAAIERATCHGIEQVWVAGVGEHLGFQHTAHNTRRLRPHLESLQINHGWLGSSQQHAESTGA